MGQENILNSEKVCIICGHKPCQICQDFCDEMVEHKDGTWEICDCFDNDGKCKYEE